MKDKKIDKQDFNKKAHWEQVYLDKTSTEVSWYQKHPQHSLDLIKATSVDVSERIIDVGGGASRLVDCLLGAGYENISVLDISRVAIEQAKLRLGNRKNKVVWIEHDITDQVGIDVMSDKPFDVWHDRAVFHFLTEERDRLNYVRTMSSALKPGAHIIIATFDLNGPKKCSGLDVMRYSPKTMAAVLGNNFQFVEAIEEVHITPGEARQSFIYCRFIRV